MIENESFPYQVSFRRFDLLQWLALDSRTPPSPRVSSADPEQTRYRLLGTHRNLDLGLVQLITAPTHINLYFRLLNASRFSRSANGATRTWQRPLPEHRWSGR